ncbi:MAG: NOB1 family endonuclease [Candidatus Hermodarchaeota archaeon]
MIALKSKNNNIKKFNHLIFDTNIFLTGIDFNLIKSTIYIVPEVIEEIKHKKYLEKNRNIIIKIEAAIESKKLKIKTPSEKYVQKVEAYSRRTGDYSALSITDKKLIALTLELKNTFNEEVIIYTNDYSMENLCSELKIPFSPLMKDGIKSKITWEVYCPFCQEIKEVEQLNEKCERCGMPLKRRSKK